MRKKKKCSRKQNRTVKKVMIAVLIPIFFFLLLTIMMLCMIASLMPSTTVDVVAEYKKAAELAGCTWQELVVYDTVRLDNNFGNADPYKSAVEFMNMSYKKYKWIKPEDEAGYWKLVSEGTLTSAESICNYLGLSVGSNINDVKDTAKELVDSPPKKTKYEISFWAKELDDLIIEKKFNEEKIQWADMLMVSGALENMFGEVYDLPDYIEVTDGGFFGWPTPELKTVTSKFDQNRLHPTLNIIRPHNGVDISGVSAMGSPVVSIHEGKVTHVNTNGGERGINIRVQHDINGDVWVSRYQHLSAVKCKVGDKVEKGTVIGAVGNTGIGTGPHLHLELTFNGVLLDPLPLIQ